MMREKIQALQTKAIAARYGNPANGIAVIAIAGGAGKTTVAKFLANILKESGRSVACLTNDASISNTARLYERFASLKKQHVGTVILEVNDTLLNSGALSGLIIETLVVVNESDIAHRLLGLSPKHIVVPTGFAVPAGSVEPYQHISVGEDEIADAKIDSVKLLRHGTELGMTIDHQTKLEIATYFAGHANALDLATAVAAAYVLGVNLDAVQEGIADMEAPSGAFSWLRTNLPHEVVYDNARREDSIQLATRSAKQLTKRRLIIAFDQLPSDDTIHFVHSLADRVFAVGQSGDTRDIDIEATPQDAFDKALRAAKRDDAVLLLGPDFNDILQVAFPEDNE
jgi:folylpolyglutamate synthase/dihydropteroate synthase